MAANLQMRGFCTGVVRGVNKIICGNLRDPTSAQPYILQNSAIQGSFRRFVHSSLYEKNEDDGAQLNRVPEDVIEPKTQKAGFRIPKLECLVLQRRITGPVVIIPILMRRVVTRYLSSRRGSVLRKTFRSSPVTDD